MLKRYLLFLLFIISGVSVATNPEEKEGVKGNFDLGLNYSKNVNKTLQFNNVFLLRYKKKRSNLNLRNNISFITKTGEDELLNKGTQDFKYSYKSKKWSTDFNLQHLYDISRNIQKRWMYGLGLSYDFLEEDNKKLGVGISGLKEIETPTIGENKMQKRISGNVDFSCRINNIEIIGSTHYQPNLEEIGDFRMKSMLALRVIISPHFLLSINNTFNYDSFPAEGIPETDYQLINSISYTF